MANCHRTFRVSCTDSLLYEQEDHDGGDTREEDRHAAHARDRPLVYAAGAGLVHGPDAARQPDHAGREQDGQKGRTAISAERRDS